MVYIKLNNDLKEVCKMYGFRQSQITSHKRDADSVAKRRKVAIKLRAMGYSYPMIGHVMNRDHTTIMHMIKTTPAETTLEILVDGQQIDTIKIPFSELQNNSLMRYLIDWYKRTNQVLPLHNYTIKEIK